MDAILNGLLCSTEANEDFKTAVLDKISSSLITRNISKPEYASMLNICLRYLESNGSSGLNSNLCFLLETILSKKAFDLDFFLATYSCDIDTISHLCYGLELSSVNLIYQFFFPAFCNSWDLLQSKKPDSFYPCEFQAVLIDIFSWKLPLDTMKIQTLHIALEHFTDNFDSHHSDRVELTAKNISDIVNFLANFHLVFRHSSSHTMLYTQTCNEIAHVLLLMSSTNIDRGPDNTVFSAVKPFITDSQQNNYLSLVALINQLERLYLNDLDTYTKTVTSCIGNLVDSIHNLSVLQNTILRIISWSQWPEDDNYGCTDLWVIGILSEFGRRNSQCIYASASVFHDILLPMLKLTLETYSIANFKSVPLINILSLILIISGLLNYSEEVSSHCQNLATFLLKVLNSNPDQFEYDVALLSKMGILFKMATYLASSQEHSNFNAITKQGKLSKLLKLFDLISRKYPSVDAVKAGSCLKMYSWNALISSGSEAGFKLRSAWKSWCNDSSETFGEISNNPLTITNDSYASTTLANLPGLRNKGNTCYANAALQLLYNCSDFREALLAPLTTLSPEKKSCAEPLHSQASTEDGTTSVDCNLWPLTSSTYQQPLHKTLLHLFSTLSNTKMETAQDPSAVLTLSKPSHFIQGEQQDSAEYLNHLLDCLHEEELRTRLKQQRIADDASEFAATANSEEGIIETKSFSSPNETVADSNLGHRSLIRRLFGGTISRCTACAGCQHVSSAELEDFICLFVPLNGHSSSPSSTSESEAKHPNDLASLVQTNFSNVENVTGMDECEACGLERSRTRHLSLRRLSPNVLICLNRFTYNRQTCSTQKLMQRIRINEQLSVAVASSTEVENERGDEQQTYRLQGIILHHGLSLAYGHYTCVARVGPKWVSFDDGSSYFTSLDQVNRQQFATPYLLLYSKV